MWVGWLLRFPWIQRASKGPQVEAPGAESTTEEQVFQQSIGYLIIFFRWLSWFIVVYCGLSAQNRSFMIVSYGFHQPLPAVKEQRDIIQRSRVSRVRPEAAMTPGASTKAAGFMSLSENNHWINWIPRFCSILICSTWWWTNAFRGILFSNIFGQISLLKPDRFDEEICQIYQRESTGRWHLCSNGCINTALENSNTTGPKSSCVQSWEVPFSTVWNSMV